MSNETSYTPGPWVAQGSLVMEPGGEFVTGCVLGGVLRGDEEEDYATARLIAAAPDLLEACEAVIKSMQTESPTPEEAISLCVRAIAKAKGEQS
jgi:hypothetical protein